MTTATDPYWTRVEQGLPPEGQVVRTIGPGGLEQDLKRQGPLWFMADGAMYVYYTPIFWKEI